MFSAAVVDTVAVPTAAGRAGEDQKVGEPGPESLKQTLEGVRCPHGGSPPLEVPVRKPGPEVLMLGIVWCVQYCQNSDFKILHHQLQPVSDWEIYQWVSFRCTARRTVYIAELNALWCPW